MFAQESVMGIKELKAEFEKLKYIEEKLEYLNFDEHLDCYVEKSNGMPVRLAAWVNGAFYGFKQAATAQAVPEGFVVLKISDVREILSNASDAMDAESPSSVFTQTGIPSTWYDHHLVAEKNILDAIKAQEQVG